MTFLNNTYSNKYCLKKYLGKIGNYQFIIAFTNISKNAFLTKRTPPPCKYENANFQTN